MEGSGVEGEEEEEEESQEVLVCSAEKHLPVHG